VELATQLIDGMSDDWDARQYHDEYRDVLMKLIEKKIKTGQTEAITSEDGKPADDAPRTIDFMEVLQESVAKTSKSRRPPAPRSPGRKPARRRTRRRQAG
jgi:DNA end-binding protein Ku